MTGSDGVRVLTCDEVREMAGAFVLGALEPAEDAFLRAVAGRGTATPTVADALRAHVLADAVYRSAAEGGAPIDTTAVGEPA